jgi:hypothetical protein
MIDLIGTLREIYAQVARSTTSGTRLINTGGAWVAGDTIFTLDNATLDVVNEYMLDIEFPTAGLVVYEVRITTLKAGSTTPLPIATVDATTAIQARRYPIGMTNYFKLEVRQLAGAAQTINYKYTKK